MKELIALEYEDPNKKNFLSVEIALGNVCNYSCSYCPSMLHNGSNGWLNFNNLQRFVSNLRLQNPEKEILIKMLGGEPTLYPHIKKFIEILKQNNIKTQVLSNGARTIRWWESVSNSFDKISLSFHPETSTVEHFQNVIKVFDGKIVIFVWVMMPPELFDKSLNAIEILRSYDFKNVSVKPKFIFPDFGPDLADYTKEQLDIFYDLMLSNNDNIHEKYYKDDPFNHGQMISKFSDGSTELTWANEMILNRTNDFLGWSCYAGVDNMIIDSAGEIFGGWCHVNRIGNINDDEIIFPTKSVICTKQHCDCVVDFNIRKSK